MDKAGRKEWIGLGVISLACLLYVMDLSVLYLAVPSLTRDLEPSSSQLLWITDVYGFLVAGFLITMGTLGDRIGRRKVLLAGAAAFGAASVLAAFSTSAEMLIVARALLGIAGATVAPAIPSNARAPISISALVENAASTDATPKSAAPMKRTRRRPIRSPSVPAAISEPATRNP